MDIFSPMYEGFNFDLFYFDNFSNDLFKLGIYDLVGIIMIISSFFLMIIYYYGLSKYKTFYKKLYWILWVSLICLINYRIAHYNSLIAMEDLYKNSDDGQPYSWILFFKFSMVNVLWTFLFCFAFSLLLKIKSDTASKTPF